MVSRKQAAVVGLTVAALTAPAVALAADAGAAQAHGFYTQKVLTRKAIGPLQFAVGTSKVYVADAFTSTLFVASTGRVIAHGGKPNPSGEGGDLSGVGINQAAGEVAYTWTNGGAHKLTKFTLRRAGKEVYSINLAAYEGKNNPDKVLHYGVKNPSKCVSDGLKKIGLDPSYTGLKDSHPYATTYWGNGTWAVADAGGNDVLLINPARHTISAVVIPSVPITITKALQQAAHLPKCTVGVVYRTESVPTDVESGPNGNLYVSSLPASSEYPGVPPTGRIYTLSQAGKLTMIGNGFAGLTNIAVRPNGYVYAAELNLGRVTRLVNGRPGPVVYRHAGAVAVEWANNHLYVANAPAAAQQKGGGSVVRLGYR